MFIKQFKLTAISLLFLSGLTQSVCYSMDTHTVEVNHLLNQYIKDHKRDESVTGITASVSLPNEKIQTYYAGKVSNHSNAKLINAENLFQIGSITKSFTSAIILQLEAEGKLNINQTIGLWLPQYSKWKNVTIKQLLNMTSGIPDYIEIPKIAKESIKKQWRDTEIVDIAYASSKKTSGFNYSNTNYLILGMIIEKATRHTFVDEINSRLIQPYNLDHTFYLVEPFNKHFLSLQPS